MEEYRGRCDSKISIKPKEISKMGRSNEKIDKITREWEVFIRSFTGRNLTEKEPVDGEFVDENLSTMNQIGKSVLVTIQLS